MAAGAVASSFAQVRHARVEGSFASSDPGCLFGRMMMLPFAQSLNGDLFVGDFHLDIAAPDSINRRLIDAHVLVGGPTGI